MEWKELEIDNLPPDILTGDYEFQLRPFGGSWKDSINNAISDRWGILKCLSHNSQYRYRKPEPKAPTHEEIMTKWWRTDKNNCWVKPVQYFEGFYGLANTVYAVSVKNQPKEWFIGRESADIPPETTND